MKRILLYLAIFVAAACVTIFFMIGTRPPQPQPQPQPQPRMSEIEVYFTDMNRFKEGTEPYEVPVTRLVPAAAGRPEAALTEFFKGPTAEERRRGLAAVTSGFTGFSRLEIRDGIARVHLTGTCASGGATYTVAQPIFKNLLQFKEIKYVKIYDAAGATEVPEGPSNSIPECLEP